MKFWSSTVPAALRRESECRLISVFLRSCAMILLVTGTAKTWTSFWSGGVLSAPDPITGIAFGKVMLVVGLIEIAASLHYLTRPRNVLVNALMIAWLSTSFTIYRLGLWWIGYHKPCGCLGNLADALHLTSGTADRIMQVLLGYMLLGSCLVLYRKWPHTRYS